MCAGLFLPPAEEERLFDMMQELLAIEDISTRLPFLHCARWPEVDNHTYVMHSSCV
jgi:hypothetical protein